MARKRFKRYQPPAHLAGTGLDIWPRDKTISEETYTRNWCRTFGHHLLIATYTCKDCGISLVEATAANEEFAL